MYPMKFSNSGETGRQKMELNRPAYCAGWIAFPHWFSEWLSHVYYDEDLTALLALYDFASDDEICRKAEMVLDLLVFDMALNSFKGVFGSTHGRAYENTKKWASNEGTTDASKLLFGMGYSPVRQHVRDCVCVEQVSCAKVIESIASGNHFENRQRMGIKLAEMEKWGIRPDNFEDGMLYLTLEAYLHPRTSANTIRMFDTCNWWENSFLNDFKPYRGLLKALGAVGGLPLLARFLNVMFAAIRAKKSIFILTKHQTICSPPRRIIAKATAETSSTSGRPRSVRTRSASRHIPPGSKE
jgi:hypothetical protein